MTGAVLGAALLMWMVPLTRAELADGAGRRMNRMWHRGRHMAREMMARD